MGGGRENSRHSGPFQFPFSWLHFSHALEACNIRDGLAHYEEKAPRGTEFQLSGGGRSSLRLNRKQFSPRVQIIVP